MNLNKHPYLKEQYQNILQSVTEAVSTVPPSPFGHAFLWGYVTLQQKNGKPKVVKVCLGSVCSEDLERTRALAESVPGVSDVWYNMD